MKYFSPTHRINLSKAIRNRKLTQEWKDNISKAHIGIIIPSMRGDLHPNWKGPAAGISGIHKWVRSRKVKPEKCELCNKKRKLQLSSKNHAYTRDINEYQYLCISCHRKWDIEHNKYSNHLKFHQSNVEAKKFYSSILTRDWHFDSD